MAILTFEQAIEEVADRLGGRRDVLARIEDWLNQSQIIFARADIELPALDVTVTKTTVANQATYSLATTGMNGLGITNLMGIRVIRNEGGPFKLVRFPWTEFRRIATQASGPPVRWSRYGDLLATDPVSDQIYTLTIDYRRNPVLGTLEFGDLWLEEIIRLATYLGWNALGEPQQAASQLQLLPGWVQQRLMTPLTEEEWEASWDEALGFAPAEFY
jgi:hypothetical protein